MKCLSFYFIFLMFIYFWERETECEWGRDRDREGDTESEAGSRHWAVSTEPNTGPEFTSHEIMTWAKVGHSTNWATQAPQCLFIFERERERDRACAGEGQRERETQNQKQALGSELSAQSPTRGSNSQAVRSWPELKLDAQLTEPLRCPENSIFLKFPLSFLLWPKLMQFFQRGGY